ncbi:MAG: hypothetical protein VZR00_00515 [Lachnospiraceae bacterium]|jgi:arginine decarboxylase|nr:hypothetical protein [Lachnospiraceae bacterium]MEE3460358.1 hypothetical protein [Lachnospiraceae bacterium]
MTTPIFDFVKNYAEKDPVRVHMPGHKGLFSGFEYKYDITEISEDLCLYEDKGIVRKSQDNASAIFGTGRTYYSAEGSSLAIKAMLAVISLYDRAVRGEGAEARKNINPAAEKITAENRSGGLSESRNESQYHTTVLAARNVHKSFIAAAAALDLDVILMDPELEPDNAEGDVYTSGNHAYKEAAGQADPGNERGAGYRTDSIITTPITKYTIDHYLKKHKDRHIAAVYVTSPDYLGTLYDIKGFAEVCHRHGIPLLVDNAHGAYLKFMPEDIHPVTLGAAMCADSAHKTLPVLTGGAYLHISKEYIGDFKKYVYKAFAMFASTSPSFLISMSLDQVNPYLAGDVRKFKEICDKSGGPEGGSGEDTAEEDPYLTGNFRADLKACIDKVSDLKCKLIKLGFIIKDTERLKLVLDASNLKYTGEEIYKKLYSEYNISCEYGDSRHLVMMFTPLNRNLDFFNIYKAFYDIINKENVFIDAGNTDEFYCPVIHHEQVISIREAWMSDYEFVPVKEAAGRICAHEIVTCPPAVPINICGERITEGDIALYEHYGIREAAVVN